MPHHPEDRRYPHLRVERTSEPLERRRSGGRPPPPDRGGRAVFGPRLEGRVEDLQAAAPRASRAGPQFDPHLVFRIPTAPSTPLPELTAFLENLGITVVSIEPDKAIIAFKDDADLTRFRDAARAYQTPQPSRTTGEIRRTTDQDVVEYIDLDGFAALTPADRLGPRWRAANGADPAAIDPEARYVVDVELWATGEAAASQRAIDEITALVSRQQGSEVLDTFPGRTICLVKLSVDGRTLSSLLEEAIVAEVDLPPEPSLISLTAERAIAQELPTATSPDEDGPRLCLIDSGIQSSHPLLAPHVGHEEAITAGGSATDVDGHGTRVAGVAIYGDVEECLHRRTFDSPIWIFSARVLNDQGQFDDRELLVKQIIRAVEVFTAPPYSCNIFNLSIGTAQPSPSYLTNRQTQWAEILDRLSAMQKILFVVSTGNNYETFVLGDRAAEDQLRRYPESLFGVESRINEPATAAIAVTVGSLAKSAMVDPRHAAEGNIVRPLAERDEPSPFTRTGFGHEGAIKPELVDYGGNLVFGRFASGRGVDTDDAASILTTSHEWLTRPFAFEVGTSLATPRVSRLAALLWDELQDQLDEPVTPNLVRAVLANSASVPNPAIVRLGGTSPTDERVIRACGYGQPDEQLALVSGDRVVTLIAQGPLELDRFVVYGVPIPAEFIECAGPKQIQVALAYDPPVRRRRVPYAGTSMQFDMLRGIELEDVFDAYRKLGADEDAEPIRDARRIDFEPGINLRKKGTLQKGSFTFQKLPKYHSEDYWLVVRAIRRWAPEEITEQSYALAVTIRADEPRLYNLVRSRLTERVRGRVQL